MMKGIAVQLPRDLLDEVEEVAEAECDDDRNEAIQRLIEGGLERREREERWHDASVWRRVKWAVFGREDG